MDNGIIETETTGEIVGSEAASFQNAAALTVLGNIGVKMAPQEGAGENTWRPKAETIRSYTSS